MFRKPNAFLLNDLPTVFAFFVSALLQMAVVAGHAASQAGNMASKGAYQSTRVSMRAWTNLMERNSESAKAKEQVGWSGGIEFACEPDKPRGVPCEGLFLKYIHSCCCV